MSASELVSGRVDPLSTEPASDWFGFLDGIAGGLLETHGGVVVRSNPEASCALGEVPGTSVLAGRRLADLLETRDGASLVRDSATWVPCRLVGAGEMRHLSLRTLGFPGEGAIHIVVEEEAPAAPVLSSARQGSGIPGMANGLCPSVGGGRDQQGQFFALVAHELRTPVTVIQGYGRLLLSEAAGPLLPEQRRFLEESVKSCRRIDSFVEELMSLPSGFQVQGRADSSALSLSAALDEVVEYMTPMLREVEAKVEVRLSRGAEHVACDPRQFEQVLTNLIGNSLKYAGDGVRLQIHSRSYYVDGQEMVEVAISDDGPGIPDHESLELFAPGNRGGLPEQSTKRGKGLGLAICRSIVESCGGQIEFRPGCGGGSCFAFTLPNVCPANEPGAAHHER